MLVIQVRSGVPAPLLWVGAGGVALLNGILGPTRFEL